MGVGVVFVILILFFALFAHAGEYWHVESGASSIKMLSMPVDPRQAALAGAGIASPRSPSEVMRNPIAGAASDKSVISFSKTEFSDLTGASRMSMLSHTVFSSWHVTAGVETLNYDKLEGYNDDGLHFDGDYFTAGTIAAQLGVARKFNSMSAGINFRYANQNIDSYYEHGFLFDGGAKYSLNKYFEFGAIFNNYGWIVSDADVNEIAPLSVQAGVTATCPLAFGFSGALSADLHRRNDLPSELRTGVEILYKELFSIRFGYSEVLSGGFAVNLGFASIEYAYQNREVLEANHVFGVGLRF